MVVAAFKSLSNMELWYLKDRFLTNLMTVFAASDKQRHTACGDYSWTSHLCSFGPQIPILIFFFSLVQTEPVFLHFHARLYLTVNLSPLKCMHFQCYLCINKSELYNMFIVCINHIHCMHKHCRNCILKANNMVNNKDKYLKSFTKSEKSNPLTKRRKRGNVCSFLMDWFVI